MAPGPHRAAGPHEQWWEGVYAGDQAVGDRRRGAQHDHEVHGRLALLEEEDGEREPGDRGHGLEARDERADRGAEEADLGDRRTDHDADDQRHREADCRSPHRDPEGGPERALLSLLHQRAPDRGGRRQDELGPPPAGHHGLPQREGDPDGGRLGPGGRPQPP